MRGRVDPGSAPIFRLRSTHASPEHQELGGALVDRQRLVFQEPAVLDAIDEPAQLVLSAARLRHCSSAPQIRVQDGTGLSGEEVKRLGRDSALTSAGHGDRGGGAHERGRQEGDGSRGLELDRHGTALCGPVVIRLFL